MSEAKPFASLSSGLLARKGTAKPAMRRPNMGSNLNVASENGQDDLGWNDMGYDVNPDISQEVPAKRPLLNPLAKAVETPKPEVKQQQEFIAAQLQVSDEGGGDKDLSKEPVKPNDMALKATEKTIVIQSELMVKPAAVDSEVHSKIHSKVDENPKKAAVSKSKAAFTLRLNRDRHLKLRLACAINNISAQKFMTNLLDKALSEMDQINYLTDQIVEKK